MFVKHTGTAQPPPQCQPEEGGQPWRPGAPASAPSGRRRRDSLVAAPLACAPSAQGSGASAPRGAGSPRTSLSSCTRVSALRRPLGASEGRGWREPLLLWGGAGTLAGERTLQGRSEWARTPLSGGGYPRLGAQLLPQRPSGGLRGCPPAPVGYKL